MKKLPLYLIGLVALIMIINSFIPDKTSIEPAVSDPTTAYKEPTPTYAVTQIASGSCTDTVSWKLDSNGTLIVSGSGAIPDYEKGAGNQPWMEYWKSITALVVEDGVTRIGDRAFQSFRYLESAVIGQDVLEVGEWSFQNCHALTYVDLPPSIELETGAFRSTPVEWKICGAPSEAYANSDYYTALCNVPLTGDYREDIINIALSQVGYKEGNSEADFGGNVSGSGDYTEYGKCLESVGSAWCSEFASWCIRNAGVSTSIIANSRAANVASYTAYTSADFYTWDITTFSGGHYLPQKGDLLLWSWDGKMYGTEENLSHTSILWEATQLENSNILLTTIDGNSNNQVQVREYEVSAAEGRLIGKTGIVCYIIAPHYED